jgi:hypothetical protein
MNADANFESVEKRILRHFWADGLVDLFLGTGLLLAGLLWLSGFAVFVPLVPAGLLPLWVIARTRITRPRAGHIRFSKQQIDDTRTGLNIAGVVGFALLTLFGTLFIILRDDAGMSSGIESLVIGLPMLIIATSLLVARIAFGLPRFFIHAIVAAAAGLLGVVASIDPGLQFCGAGLTISVVGMSVFVRFLRDYPVSDDGYTG